MDELIFQVKASGDGGYTACAQGEAIFTEADSLDELRTNVHDAVRCHFARRSGPKTVTLRFVHHAAPAP